MTTTLILFGAMNYFLFGVFAAARIRKETIQHFYFALAMFSVASIMIRIAEMRGMEAQFEWLSFIPILSFAIAPALYFYIKTLTQKSTSKQMIHFIPVAAHIVYQISIKYLFYIQSPFIPSHHALNIIGIVLGICLIVQITYYIIQIRKEIHSNTNAIKEHYSDLEGKQFRWIKVLFLCIITIIFIWILTRITSWILDLPIRSLPFVFIGLWLLSYYLFAISLLQKKIKIPNQSIDTSEKISNERIINDYIELWETLNDAMVSNEYFLDEGLNLQKLSKLCNVPSRHLSECINQNGQVNFHSFVNSFRVERVKKEMTDIKNSHLTLLGIAFKAGFKSKSSFNQVFKDSTGFTPKQFIRKQ